MGARANADVRVQLVDKLGGISKQILSNRVAKLKAQLPMTTADAVHVLAHQNGIKVDRWLTADELNRVRQHVAQVGSPTPPSTTGARPRSSSAPGRKTHLVEIPGLEADALPGMSAQHVAEAKRMAAIYPLLYVFENSARDVIARVLRAALGPTWWDQVANSRLKKVVEVRRITEGNDAWHSTRGAEPIHYLDLPELSTIATHSQAWPHLKGIFTDRQTWFPGIVDDLNVSRRVVAHMNPLTVEDVRQVQAGFAKWTKQIAAKESDLP